MSFIIDPYAFAVGVGGITTPSDLTDIWAWYEPGRETGYSDGDPITPLTDQTGNGRDFTQATSGNRPKYDSTNALNGHAVASFTDGDGRWWDGPDMSALGVGTGAGKDGQAFIVVKTKATQSSADETGLWQMTQAGSASHYAYTNGLIYEACLKGSREDALTPGVSLASWRVYEVSMVASSTGGATDGDYRIRIDGTQIFFGNIVGASWPNAPTLGKNLNGQFFRGGKMAGLYLCSAKLGTTDRANLIGYINDRFALSSA